MNMFKLKYLFASLIIHSAVITSFLIFQNSTEQAETSMVVTEIIKIKEPNKADNIKKIKNYKKETKKKEIISTHKFEKEVVKMKVEPKQKNTLRELKVNKPETKAKTDGANNFLIDKKTKKTNYTNDNKLSERILNQKKDLDKAYYKIGSINNPHPPYPLIARKKGLEGKLILNVMVNEDGSVKNVTVGKSSGYLILDKVSKETIEKWVFTPANIEGKAVKDNIQVPIKFVLTK